MAVVRVCIRVPLHVRTSISKHSSPLDVRLLFFRANETEIDPLKCDTNTERNASTPTRTHRSLN